MGQAQKSITLSIVKCNNKKRRRRRSEHVPYLQMNDAIIDLLKSMKVSKNSTGKTKNLGKMFVSYRLGTVRLQFQHVFLTQMKIFVAN